jgi:hypothetical protein
MAKQPIPLPVTDDEVRDLLQRHGCPVPFHQVRTRFLGNIATLVSASPIKIVQGLLGDELPVFDSIEEGNDLLGALLKGLWNRLTRHQDRRTPFRLTRIDILPTREGLSALALMRRQELDGFVQGLFGDEEVLDLPERAHRGLSDLATIRALFAAVLEAAKDGRKAGTDKDREETLRHMRRMTRDAEHEIHAIVMSCVRARRQMLAGLPAKKPTLH